MAGIEGGLIKSNLMGCELLTEAFYPLLPITLPSVSLRLLGEIKGFLIVLLLLFVD